MDTNIQKRNVDTLRNSNRLLSLAVIVLGITLLLAIAALSRSAGREKVVVIPATIDRPISVQGDIPSDAYLEQWGLWVAHLMLDVSGASIEVTRQALLKYTLPGSHGTLENRLDFEANRLKRDASSSQFFPSQSVVSAKANAVAVVGQLDVYINERRTSSSMRSYATEFEFKSGRLFIKDFYETELDNLFKRKAQPGEAVPVAAR